MVKLGKYGEEVAARRIHHEVDGGRVPLERQLELPRLAVPNFDARVVRARCEL